MRWIAAPFDSHPPLNPFWKNYRRFDPATLPGPHFRDSDLAHHTKLSGFDL